MPTDCIQGATNDSYFNCWFVFIMKIGSLHFRLGKCMRRKLFHIVSSERVKTKNITQQATLRRAVGLPVDCLICGLNDTLLSYQILN